MHPYPQPGGAHHRPAPSSTGSTVPSQQQPHHHHYQPSTVATPPADPIAAAGAGAPVGEGYALSEEETAIIVNARGASIALGVAGGLCLVTSWSTWVGLVAGVIALTVAVTLHRRCTDGNTVYNGKSPLCCCCSTPWSQLDACSSGAITACAFGVVTGIVDVALVATSYSVTELLGIVALLNALAAIGVVVTGVIAMRAARDVIRKVFLRIDQDINQFAPAAVATGVVVPPPAATGQHQHQQQHQHHQNGQHHNPSGYSYGVGSGAQSGTQQYTNPNGGPNAGSNHSGGGAPIKSV